MRIETEVKLDFKDVLIRPKRSTLTTRSDVDISREFRFRHSGTQYHGIPIIAANMLGEEDAPSKTLQYDALGEIANVICGNMLPGIAGSNDVFHVSAPKMAESIDLPPVAEVQVGLGLGRADLLLFVSRYPALAEE